MTVSPATILAQVLKRARTGFVRPFARVLPRWITPNLLTITRLVLVVPLAVLLSRGLSGGALAVYVLAVFTDALDGELARVRGLPSRFGARLDPAVDKVLHGTVFLSFFFASPVLISLIVISDVSLLLAGTVLAVHPRSRGTDISASVYGKWKLLFQVASTLALFWNTLAPETWALDAVLKALLVLAVFFAGLSLPGYVRRLLVVVRTA